MNYEYDYYADDGESLRYHPSMYLDEIPTVNNNVAIDIKKFPKKKFTDMHVSNFEDINDFIFAEDAFEGYLTSYCLIDYCVYKYHKKLKIYPHIYKCDFVNLDKFTRDLFKHINIPEKSITKFSYSSTDLPKPMISSMIIRFSKDVIFYNTSDSFYILYTPGAEKDENSVFYTLMGVLNGYKRPRVDKNRIYVVYRSMRGFDKTGFDVKKLNIDINENYNDDFKDVSNSIIAGLNDKKKTNLVILHGEPGTGKTTYIRYLTSKLKKNIIFISPDMVESITDPAFIPFLMSNNESILIIEDAEPALEKRGNSGRSSAVSNVLNLTDGLLSDCLKISIVATFNTDKKTLDEALLRKGRLLMNYKFERLSVEKSNKLLQKLGHKNAIVTEPLTLADIYFYGTNNQGNTVIPKKIGFA